MLSGDAYVPLCISKSRTLSKRGSYLADIDSFSSWLNIFLRREDALDATSCVIFFRFLQLFNHTIPMDTWTVQVFCLDVLLSSWYRIWSCKRDKTTKGSTIRWRVKKLTLSMWSDEQIDDCCLSASTWISESSQPSLTSHRCNFIDKTTNGKWPISRIVSIHAA